MQNNQAIAVVGAGLVGTLNAIYLKKRGYDVKVFEKRKDPRTYNADAGRSINLALSERGLNALREIGIEQTIQDSGVPMYGRAVHDIEGKVINQAYGINNQHIISISRNDLNKKLLDISEEIGIDLNFESPVQNVDLENGILEFDQNIKLEFFKIVGSDGAFSIVRRSMMKLDRFNYSQEYLEHGYKELTIEANPDGSYKLDPHALHIWPRQTFMLIALPNPGGSFTCTLFLPFEGPDSFANLNNEKQVHEFFHQFFPDIMPIIPDLNKQFWDNPTSSLITIKCSPWSYKNKVFLLGDSSHAMVPFYGQGMNSGFEDVWYLNHVLNQFNEDWELALPKFQRKRKLNADAVAELALINFLEMRDKVGYPNFQKRKFVEKQLAKLAPEEFIPVYSLVTFSNVPYTYALDQYYIQDKFFDYLFEDPLLRRHMDLQNWDVILEVWRERFANSKV